MSISNFFKPTPVSDTQSFITVQFKQAQDYQIKLGALLMATLKDVQASIAKLSTDIAAEKVLVLASIATLNGTIATLQAQLANGTQVSAADLQSLVDSLNGVDVQVQAITTPVV